jgi:LmbE family N-acetylglucosaminyl deacetylase
MPATRLTLRLAVSACVLAVASLHAQQIPDPANLTGEHVSPPALADTLPINHGAPALQQLLVKLRTRASMMLIVAHPDDEDGGFVTYESRGQGARVAMFTLNRGEGGQNLMSADFNDALGLIRTQELLAAGRYMGVDQFFGTEVDFGFSKTKEESFAKWTHDRVLYDAVRVVRLYRPLVLASVFVGGVTDGHGQHQVSGEISQEVFNAAADPKVFPEMGLPPWAALKVYARTPFARIDQQGMYDYATGKYSPVLFHNYVTGVDVTHAPVATVLIHEGEVGSLIGMNGDTYSQFARRGLALQRSQIGGGGRAGLGGPGGDAGYTLMGSRVAKTAETEQSVFDNIDVTLPGIATLAPDAPKAFRAVLQVIDMNIEKAQKAFDPANVGATAEPLRLALQTLDTLTDGTEKSNLPATQKFNVLHELRIKRVQLNDALVLALGLQAKTFEEKDSAPLNPGSKVHFRTEIQVPQSANGVNDIQVRLDTPAGPIKPASGDPAKRDYSFTFTLPPDAAYTRPYFSQKDTEQPYYDVSDPRLRNAPATPAPFVGVVHVVADGVPLELRSIASGLSEGTPRQAAAVVPPLSISIEPMAGIVRLDEAALKVFTVVRPTGGSTATPWAMVATTLRVPPGSKVTSDERSTSAQGALQDTFNVQPGALHAGAPYPVTAVATYAHHDYTETLRAVGYPGLTITNRYTPAIYKASAVNVTTAANLRVAYLPGTGDSIPDFLPNLGVTPEVIKLSDLNTEKLAKFDVLILGVRSYAAHPELVGKGSAPIIDYAKNGGVVIVQYNNGRYGADEAPYPITTALSSGDHAHDVVDESRPVTVLEPNAPLLSWPNKITAADFNNWVEERGHGFAGTWSNEYNALLETHDDGQEPQKGGLLVAPVGKGAYIYCGLALYRQLPEGVPGAYRLYANLLSYAKNPKR